MNKKIAYTAETIFTGNSLLQHYAIIVDNGGLINAIIPLASIDATTELMDFGDAIITPAFIDLQLYGANGRLLAVYPDAETVRDIYQYSKKGGAAWCMPTVATNTNETIFACIDAIRDYWKHGGKGVLGLHVEGPWINKEKRGAHRAEWIYIPNVEQAKEILNYGQDVIRIITLAPEVCSEEIIRLIKQYGIIVSAGHANASYDQAIKSFNAGIPVATHLFNAMSSLQHRAPGMVGAIFDHPAVKASIIPDGHHVDYAAIKIAKKIMNERLFVITDAVTETNKGYYQHTLEGDKYTANGILSGSALTMHKAVKNLVEHAGITLEEALRMCSLYPLQVMQMNDQFGLIKQGYYAVLTVLDDDLNVVTVID